MQPHSTYLTIEGTAPPGMLIEVETVFRDSYRSGRSSVPSHNTDKVVSSTCVDSNGKYSLRIEFLREQWLSSYWINKSKRSSETTLYLSLPQNGLCTAENDDKIRGSKAAIIMPILNDNKVSGVLTCASSYKDGNPAWECQPFQTEWFKIKAYGKIEPRIGKIEVYPKSKPFTLDIQIKERTVEERKQYLLRQMEELGLR
ncbi:hypothetical protein [Desulfovibrio litoralis]|nr:hypothetical protein [Desulfovibrio litoralis]